MASSTSSSTCHCCSLLIASCLFLLSSTLVYGQLTTSFYASSCPALESVVRSTVAQAMANDTRMGASLIRLFFHDCFVQGCDASILLDDVPGSFVGEKTAFPNANSVRGYDVINSIKTAVEANCPGVVSCADIVALAARDGTVLLGGPSWAVQLGRRDSTTASQSLANSDLPSPASDLKTLINAFGKKGLSARDMTALSGAHTVGFARCQSFRAHIYNDTDIDPAFAAAQQGGCSFTPGATDGSLAPLDERSGLAFDNAYYADLVARRVLLHSDQELYNGGSQDALVSKYSSNSASFFSDFVAAMIKMGNISPLTGTAGQIRASCGVVNSS
ncbi:hypothetical protein U9M48_025071 [Paspalum notatum var. saurae]|uniref:Peroxidase n=1 Tax=Paspalum notatum var. saurae TaxID=547442 RepID=A0AAQ3TPU0_PASNO